MIMVRRAGESLRLGCEKLIAEGYYFDFFNLEGGIIGWKNVGCQTKK